jgi:hypothetical protein
MLFLLREIKRMYSKTVPVIIHHKVVQERCLVRRNLVGNFYDVNKLVFSDAKREYSSGTRGNRNSRYRVLHRIWGR